MRTDSGAGLWRLREADIQQRAWEQRLHCGPAHQHDTDNIFKQINVSIISSHVFVSITDGHYHDICCRPKRQDLYNSPTVIGPVLGLELQFGCRKD